MVEHGHIGVQSHPALAFDRQPHNVQNVFTLSDLQWDPTPSVHDADTGVRCCG